jgi:DNA-binding NtrC family response regulator
MAEDIRALLLHSYDVPGTALKRALEDQFIATEMAHSFTEASARIACSNPPHLVFTETDLPDGTWCDVVDLAARASRPVSVIVVSPVADIPLYIDVMERRAFDFITHSFTAPELSHVLRCAVDDIIRQRKELPGLPVGSTKGKIRPSQRTFKKT